MGCGVNQSPESAAGRDEEALTAFGMALNYAEREGVRLADLHTIEEGITSARERELVDKYNVHYWPV